MCIRFTKNCSFLALTKLAWIRKHKEHRFQNNYQHHNFHHYHRRSFRVQNFAIKVIHTHPKTQGSQRYLSGTQPSAEARLNRKFSVAAAILRPLSVSRVMTGAPSPLGADRLFRLFNKSFVFNAMSCERRKTNTWLFRCVRVIPI